MEILSLINNNWGVLLALGIGAFILLGLGRGNATGQPNIAYRKPRQPFNFDLDITRGDFSFD